MLKALCGFVLAVLLAAPAQAQAPTPHPQPEEATTMIAAAAVIGNDVWLRTDDGKLIALDLTTGERRTAFESGVAAMAKTDEGLWVLRTGGGRVVLSSLQGGAFADLSYFPQDADDRALALLPRGRGALVLSTRAVRRFEHNSWTVHALSSALEFGRAATVVGAPRAGRDVYLGYERGEWGGGVLRIDPDSGDVASVADVNATAIISDPANAACVIVADGVVHFFANGRIIRVCGNEVTTVYSHEYKPEPTQPAMGTIAFFALAPTPRGFLATGLGKLYRFEGGEPAISDEPRLEVFGNVWLARDQTDRLLLVGTETRRRYSVSGFSILFAPVD